MFSTTFSGRPVREPSPRTIHDVEAEEPSECGFCGTDIAPGSEWCSDLCRDLGARDAAGDLALDLMDEEG